MAKKDRVLDGSEPQEEAAQLLAVLIRLMLPSQTAAILELDKVGFSPARIAELLGTTPGTASVTVQKNKSKPKSGRQRAKLKAAPQVDEGDDS